MTADRGPAPIGVSPAWRTRSSSGYDPWGSRPAYSLIGYRQGLFLSFGGSGVRLGSRAIRFRLRSPHPPRWGRACCRRAAPVSPHRQQGSNLPLKVMAFHRALMAGLQRGSSGASLGLDSDDALGIRREYRQSGNGRRSMKWSTLDGAAQPGGPTSSRLDVTYSPSVMKDTRRRVDWRARPTTHLTAGDPIGIEPTAPATSAERRGHEHRPNRVAGLLY